MLDVHPSEDGDGVDVEYRSVVGGRLGMVGLCFATLLFAQLAYVFAVRGERPFMRAGRNPVLIWAVAASAAVGAAVLAIPSLGSRFGAVQLEPGQLAAALALALGPFAVTECAKLIRAHDVVPSVD